MVRKRNILKSLGFFLLVVGIVLFAFFPFLQMISTSLKYQWDWGNPSLIPRKLNLEAYAELLNIGQELKNVPESVKRLLEEQELTEEQKRAILARYRDTSDVFPSSSTFRNALFLSLCGRAPTARDGQLRDTVVPASSKHSIWWV